jgi:hypothetical protein
MTGLMSSVSSAKVAISMIRIAYTRLRQLLSELGETMLGNEGFIMSIMDFYHALNQFVFDKLQDTTPLVYIDVLCDTVRIMTKLGSATSKNLSTIQGSTVHEALKQSSPFLQKFFLIFLDILRKKCVDFCVFQHFGNTSLLDYFGVCFELIQILVPFLDVDNTDPDTD